MVSRTLKVWRKRPLRLSLRMLGRSPPPASHMAIFEPDWKHLRSLHPLALERFCERVLAECTAAIQDESLSPHARYLQLYELIRERDRTIASAFDGLRRSTAIEQLADMHRLKLLSEDEFDRFSAETRAEVLRISVPALDT